MTPRRYPYLYNLIDEYHSLEKYNNGYTIQHDGKGSRLLNKMTVTVKKSL